MELKHYDGVVPKKPKYDGELCPICGDRVSGFHYGILTCESCKQYKCDSGANCHVEQSCRKRCPSCRYQKCLVVGMKMDAVREDRQRGGRNKFNSYYIKLRKDRSAMKSQPDSTLAGNQASRVATGQSAQIQYFDLTKYNANLQSLGSYSLPSSYPLVPITINTPFLASSSPSTTSISSASPILPLCSTPTETTVNQFFTSNTPTMEMSFIPRILSQTVKNDAHAFAVHVADENLHEIVKWAKQDEMFSKLELNDQMRLLQTSWLTIHIIDITNAMVLGTIPSKYEIGNGGEEVSIGFIALLGNQNLVSSWEDIVVKLKNMGFSKNDYHAFRCLALFDEAAFAGKLQVLQAWSVSNTTLLEIFSQIRQLASNSIQYVWGLHTACPSLWEHLNPDKSIALELIKCVATRSSGDRQMATPQTTYAPVVYMTS
ncbi:hypothetical protein GCK72_007727 [Caenorhabditis remanei]|uniref:Nuclear receptor domain-containing protein n=1 Tax=Caenorhabditis remanei TaxID=31234 RepID=A0A6A5HIR8_CAERE|nr:hypothetical protein GCK72_007727 [Caenorhabditis remanei]KAF1767768.1 hypothetical protein GCK72_007727 [Caenorhabditis remanei]